MQAIAPVTTDQLLHKGQRPLLKFEILYCCCWVDLTSYVLKGSLSVSTAGAEMTPNPVAGDWSVALNNKGGRFDPDEPGYAPYNEYFKAGRKVKISIGARYSGTDYYWRRIYGFMEIPNFSIDKSEVSLSGFDNMQFLSDTKLKEPTNYWGTFAIFDSVESSTSGAELYDPPGGDAAEIGGGEEDNVANWAVKENGATTITSEDDIGGFSDYEIRFIADPAGRESEVWYQNVCAVVAGTEYNVIFKYCRTAGIHPMLFMIRDNATSALLGGSGPLDPVNDVWHTGSFSFTPSVNGNIDILLFCVVLTGASTWRIDNISISTATPKPVYKYEMPEACMGIHYVELDEGEGFKPVWPGRQKDGEEGWFYDSGNKLFYFAVGKIVEAGTDNLKIHYYTVQIPENVVADLLARAGLYSNQAEALAAMIYDSTSVLIDKVWFNSGSSALDAVRMLCERVNYRFFFNYGQRPVFKPASAALSTCDAVTGWFGTSLSIDTGDKKQGGGSLKDYVAGPAGGAWYPTSYNPPGTWDWSAKEYILFWLKSDRANTAFTNTRLYIYDTSSFYRYWNLTFLAGEWKAINKLLSTGDGESGTPPDLTLINSIFITFQANDATPFYKKLDAFVVTDFSFIESHITNIRDYEDRNEIRNRVIILGIEQALPEGAEETKPSKFKGEASEVASINKYGEHTMSIDNHLFQDQATIDAYCAIYLAAFKDPKWYTDFDIPFNPVPLEHGVDTITWRKKYEAGSTPIDQRGIVRNITINEFVISYTIEKVA